MAGQEKSEKTRNGRELQKNRTRKALVAAAGELMRAGLQPGVSDAAEAAGISRATAYRYFPSQELLVAEVALFESGGPLFLSAKKHESLPDAVGHLVRRIAEWSYGNEQPLRALLRLSLDASTGITRPGHRREWIQDALAPVRDSLDPKTYSRLSKALTLLMGIDPVVVMKDIANAGQEEAIDTLEWTARTLVAAALKGRHTAKPR